MIIIILMGDNYKSTKGLQGKRFHNPFIHYKYVHTMCSYLIRSSERISFSSRLIPLNAKMQRMIETTG